MVAFLEDSGIESLLTAEQLEDLVSLARNDLLRELDGIIDNEADSYDSEWDIEGWFEELRSCLSTLEDLFPEDTDVSIAVDMAKDHIRMRVRQLEEDYGDTWRPDDDHHAVAQTAVSVSSRSIFEDLVD